MLAISHILFLLILLIAYLIVSVALFYHWYKYTINPNIFLFSTLLYLGLTAPLLITMALSASVM